MNKTFTPFAYCCVLAGCLLILENFRFIPGISHWWPLFPFLVGLGMVQIFVTRGAYSVTASDPASNTKNQKSLDASDLKILGSEIGKDEIHLQAAEEQHGDWLQSIKTRKQPVAPAEVGHRSCSACLVSHITMKLPRKLLIKKILSNYHLNMILTNMLL